MQIRHSEILNLHGPGTGLKEFVDVDVDKGVIEICEFVGRAGAGGWVDVK